MGLRICLCRVPEALKLGISQPEGNWGGNGSLGRQISGSTRLPSGPLQVGWRKSGSLRCSTLTVPAERHCSKLPLLQALPRPQSGSPTIVALLERRVHFGQIWLAGASPLAAPRSSAPSGQPQRCFRRPALHARQHAPPRAPQPPPQPAHRCVACRPSHSRGQGCCSDFTEAVNCLPSPLLFTSATAVLVSALLWCKLMCLRLPLSQVLMNVAAMPKDLLPRSFTGTTLFEAT